jgi:hypothetical protein
MVYGPYKYPEITTKEKRNSSLGANGLTYITKAKGQTYSTCYSYFDPMTIMRKKNPLGKGYLEESWGSSFTTGPSVMCKPGYILMNFLKVATCVKPPPELVKYKRSMIPEKYYATTANGKTQPWFKRLKKYKNWDPFSQGNYNPKYAFKRKSQYSKYKALGGVIKSSKVCYTDFLGQCINCPRGYFFSQGESKNTYQAKPPYRYVTTHTASGCHYCLKRKKHC